MEKKLAMHFVCTMEEVPEIASKHKNFWVSDCGCRERKGRCTQSRHDVCLIFNKLAEGSGGEKKEINKEQLQEIFSEAENKKLVPRPFRSDDRNTIEGICFCCNDCCAYFLDPSEACDKGAFVESTLMDDCTHCGLCVDLCYFGARKMKNDKLIIISKNCYGCGLCVNSCPAECISMLKRK
jgi:Pyruvate/2-oxoacid:ferredoxin oxidoreductase delta subunit